MTATLTMLNEMAGNDFPAALATHQAWGIRTLDLKGRIFGKSLLELTDGEAEQAAQLIRERGMTVYCLSTTLFHADVEAGEAVFRHDQLGGVSRAIALAHIFQPSVIRLLAARTCRRAGFDYSITYLQQKHPWLIPLYREAVDQIAAAGFHTTIENEVAPCILATPAEVVDFFAALQRPDTAHFTWDVQNFWQCGTFPAVEVYAALKPLIGYYHVKGGQTGDDGHTLQWASTLEDAAWPVVEITRQVVADGVSPVICLNPSHGQARPDYDYTDLYKRDIDFLRWQIPEII